MTLVNLDESTGEIAPIVEATPAQKVATLSWESSMQRNSTWMSAESDTLWLRLGN